MSETDRVQRWRQRRREEGKEPMTLWVSREDKLRLEALAQTWHCSPSELVHQALAQFHPGKPGVPGHVPDTGQLQAVIQEALVQAPAVTAFVTDAVTATLARDLPALVRQCVEGLALEALGAPVTDTNGNVPDTEAGASVTDTNGNGTDTEAPPAALDRPPSARTQSRARGEVPAAVLAYLAQHQPATPAQVAQALGYHGKQGVKAVWQALRRLCNDGQVTQEEKQYWLALA